MVDNDVPLKTRSVYKMADNTHGSQGEGPCWAFSTLRGCRFGQRCKYSHDKSLTDNSQQENQPPYPSSSSPWTTRQNKNKTNVHTPTQTQRIKLQHWTRLIPLSNDQTSLGNRLPMWIKTAADLVACDEVEVVQQVITKLASEGGFMRIQEILHEAPKAPVTQQDAFYYLNHLAAPLLKTIAHQNVLKSLLLERPRDDIYNLLYGTAGKRAMPFFKSLADIFSVLRADFADLVDEFNAALTVFHHMVELNGSAKVNEDLTPALELFGTVLNENINKSLPKIIAIGRKYKSISNIMAHGMGLPQDKDQSRASIAVDLLPTFDIGVEGPGKLRNSGARHNNDDHDIAQIEILPTQNELESVAPEYLPVRDPRQLHLPGVEGLIDRQFRLLREDTIGQLRDAVRFELQDLQRRFLPGYRPMPENKGARINAYHEVGVEGMVFENGTLCIRVSFSQPPAVAQKPTDERKTWWETSKSLTEEALVCLIGLDGFSMFLTVYTDRKKSDSQGRGANHLAALSEDPIRATIYLKMIEPRDFDYHQASSCIIAQKTQALFLCEFPGVLLPAFYHTLQALKDIGNKSDLPFAEILAPESTLQTPKKQLEPPDYALDPGFKFDLGVLIDDKETLELGIAQRFNYATLQKYSTLDDAQQTALVNALTRRFALIQGPPGCGKSFIGVALIKTLIQNKSEAKLGPILCVTYTNHALDQLLEHLIAQGVKQVIRVGSQSKSEILKPINLRVVAQSAEDTPSERKRRFDLRTEINKLEQEVLNCFNTLSTASSPEAVMSFLSETNPIHYSALYALSRPVLDAEGFARVDYDHRPPLHKWLKPKVLRQSAAPAVPRSIEALQYISLTDMSIPERRILYDHWIYEIQSTHGSIVAQALDRYRKAKIELQACNGERDLRCLGAANVVGLTTSGLARNLNLLRSLSSKVLVCEEAGEVLEAHMLTALLPSIEHAILIGDHEQLRPQIQNFDLQSTSSRGERFSFDVSLFERLIHPPFQWMPKLEYSTLEIQRRMHPSISELIRATLYPKLKDHPDVALYPPVPGMAKRLYWLDHQVPEQASDHTKSHSNHYEADVVACLVSHLTRQCHYQSQDIAVLTPYLGQLRLLRRKLGRMFEIVVDERDQLELQKQGLGEETSDDTRKATTRSTLLRTLRLATVDNFQGEEAKVVVISLVRSNSQKKCGFLRTSNRANVLLSRAQHGMYLVGDSSCYEAYPVWGTVIDVLRRDDNIGPQLQLQCPRHPDQAIKVAAPDDFIRQSPEGGCNARCPDRLDCGHQCPNRCHTKTLHDAVFCQVRCRRPRKGCNHLCEKSCGAECGLCGEPVKNVRLPCGHVSLVEPCHVSQDPSKAQCQVLVEQTIPGCKHKIMLKCSTVLDDTTKCTSLCGSSLSCDHTCKYPCYQCTKRQDSEVLSVKHPPCQTQCGTKYSTCAHYCVDRCHPNEPECTSCKARCETHCWHSHCAKLCAEPCAPCAEVCMAGCKHSGTCHLPCAVPCDIIPCKVRCDIELSCGHQCPSVCGEACPPAENCHICCNNSKKEQVVDYTEFRTYADVDLNKDPCFFLSCGHIITLTNLDGLMEMAEHYEAGDEGQMTSLKGTSRPFSVSTKTCIECRKPIRNLQRYNRIWRRANLDESTKKFIAFSTTEFAVLSEKLDREEKKLLDKSTENNQPQASREQNDFMELADGLHITGNFNDVIKRICTLTGLNLRYLSIMQLRNIIENYLKRVAEDEQPYGRIYNLVRSARLQGVDSADKLDITDHTVLQSKQRMMATGLSIRCNMIIMSDFATIRRGCETTFTGKNDWRTVNIVCSVEPARQQCLTLAGEALNKNSHMIEVEAFLNFARLLILERTLTTAWNKDQFTKTIEEAINWLDHCQEVCSKKPQSTPGMLVEVKAVREMLTEGVFYQNVTNEEKKAVIAAMATEFQVSGHWYQCPNGHPFTIGECGLAMQISRCPECGEAVGGQSHQLMDRNRVAEELVDEFEGLDIDD